MLDALVEETNTTRRKREELLARGDGKRAMGLRFVQANKSNALITKEAKRGKNSQKQEMINHYVLEKLLGTGSYGACRRRRPVSVYSRDQCTGLP